MGLTRAVYNHETSRLVDFWGVHDHRRCRWRRAEVRGRQNWRRALLGRLGVGWADWSRTKLKVLAIFVELAGPCLRRGEGPGGCESARPTCPVGWLQSHARAESPTPRSRG